MIYPTPFFFNTNISLNDMIEQKNDKKNIYKD